MKKGLILAAGIGKRMKSNTPKVLHKIFGIPILSFVIKILKESELDEIYTIISDNLDLFNDEIRDNSINLLYRKLL
ncbi:MAG TPA: NTP transferase domain-containing protein [Caldisericia bacterium]|nr:NTP transferase domain-containing protein [Caldisericia bacterium]